MVFTPEQDFFSNKEKSDLLNFYTENKNLAEYILEKTVTLPFLCEMVVYEYNDFDFNPKQMLQKIPTRTI